MHDTPSLLRLTALAVFAALSACQPTPGDGTRTGDVGESRGPSATPAPVSQPSSESPIQSDALAPDAARGEAGARALLLDWARALENGDFSAAYSLLGDSDAANDMSAAEYSDYWSGFGRLTVAVPEGRMEGAAGSLYYEVPATITAEEEDGSAPRWEGRIVLRRVNDVPGASSGQLRWHFEAVDLERQ